MKTLILFGALALMGCKTDAQARLDERSARIETVWAVENAQRERRTCERLPGDVEDPATAFHLGVFCARWSNFKAAHQVADVLIDEMKTMR